MTLADSTTAFALNGRAATYFPQARRIDRDPRGAGLFSLLIWTFFAVADVATACYTLTISDRIMAIMFSLNAIGCLAIAGLIAFKCIDVAHHRTMLWHRIASLRHSQNPVESARFAAVISSRCVEDCSLGVRHRDVMIRQGLMS